MGLLLEFLFFNVDYRHKETLQFEDDDYVYFVSAVPKIRGGQEPPKEVKRLKKESDEKPQPGKQEDKKKPENQGKNKQSSGGQKQSGKKQGAGKQGSAGKNQNKNQKKKQQQGKQQSGKQQSGQKQSKDPSWREGMTDELLMTQSLRRDLEKEL